MRFATAYYLLLLYCLTIVKSAIPAVCDELSHLCNEEKHLATVHALYGSQHVQTEIGNMTKDDSAKSNFTFQNEPTATHIFTQAYVCPPTSQTQTRIRLYNRMSFQLPHPSSGIVIPPPDGL